MEEGLKKCNKCNEVMDLSSFQWRRENESYRLECKNCVSIRSKERYRSKKGIIKQIFTTQSKNSIKRNHNPPEYSLKELTDYLLNSKNFKNIYQKWVESDFQKKLTPSLDRVDNDKGYSFYNVIVTTWGKNESNSFISKQKVVIINDKIYDSVTEASNKLNIPRTTLTRWINDKSKLNFNYYEQTKIRR